MSMMNIMDTMNTKNMIETNNNRYNYSFINPNTGAPLVKQWNYFTNILRAARGEIDKSFFYWAGSVNSSKTYTSLLTILWIAKEFPMCKLHVVRRTLPTLLSTTVESAIKLFGNTGTWYKDKSNYHFKLSNGSKIYFFSENFNADKDLDRFKGLETNGFLLEELPELQQSTFEKCKERVGRWKVPGFIMPKPIIMCTMNPTHVDWVRNLVYIPMKTASIPEDSYIQFASTLDNPFITKEEIRLYSTMLPEKYRQYIEGDWEVFDNIKAWCYSFNKERHVRPVTQDASKEIVLSFDFNVNPITCIACHVSTKDKRIEVFKEYKLDNSDIYELCREIKKIKKNYIYVVGDSTGNNRTVALPNGLTFYSIILKELGLIPASLNKLMKKNISLLDSRIVVNGVLERYDVAIDPSCEHLIRDLIAVEATEDGKIDKSNQSLTHLLDTFRYVIHSFFLSDYVSLK